MKKPLICKDCKEEIFVDLNMVMLKDHIWSSVCDSEKYAICDHCIDKRLVKKSLLPMSIDDLKPGVLCNMMWRYFIERGGVFPKDLY
jgi:hypothetical protein